MRLADRLAALAAAFGDLPAPTRDPERVRKAVREVLARPEFRPPERSLLQRAYDWLLEQVGRLLAELGASGAGGIVGLAVLVLALLGAFFFTLLLKLGGALFCLVGALVPMALFLVTTPAVMVEELGPIQAMARSVTLVRTRFWPVMGIGVLSGLLALVLESILSWPFGLVATVIGFRWGWILAAIGEILPALVTMPLVAIVATLVYFDLRIRNEGFDLQMIAAELARGAPAR